VLNLAGEEEELTETFSDGTLSLIAYKYSPFRLYPGKK
jgi:hypothetical protein